MTKKEAMRELKLFSGTTELKLSANFWEALNVAIEALEKEPKLKWTPASNPPKQDGKYLVTTHSSNHDKIEVLGYANNLYEIDNYNFWNMERAGWYGYDDEYGYFEIDEVVAWCELPEPYKESEGNES